MAERGKGKNAGRVAVGGVAVAGALAVKACMFGAHDAAPLLDAASHAAKPAVELGALGSLSDDAARAARSARELGAAGELDSRVYGAVPVGRVQPLNPISAPLDDTGKAAAEGQTGGAAASQPEEKSFTEDLKDFAIDRGQDAIQQKVQDDIQREDNKTSP
ncbi:MAG: hypothetical protein WDN76_01980 [Alphaproteobacteria bacterium]